MNKATVVLEIEVDVDKYPPRKLAEGLIHQAEQLHGVINVETR